MDKHMVKQAIDTLLNSLQKEEEVYHEAATKDEILEVRKSIRLRIKEYNLKLTELYSALEELEKE